MYRRRILIFMVVIAGALAGVTARLAYLQIVRGDELRFQAAQTLQGEDLLPARRGSITDRHGRILAIDRPCFDFCLDYRFIVSDPDWVARQIRLIRRTRHVDDERARALYAERSEATWALARRLAEQADQDLGDRIGSIRNRIEAMRAHLGFEIREQRQAHPVVPGIDESAANDARSQLHRTIGAGVRPSHKRWYPYGAYGCHIIGTIGPVTVSDQSAANLTAEDEPDRVERMQRNYLAWDTIGKTGVEKMGESILRGRRGYRRLMQGRNVLRKVPAADGSDVHLTLDIRLQQALTDRLLSEPWNGAIVVVDVKSGETLAMVSTPVYDLNRYRRDASGLYNSPDSRINLPLINRAVYRAYPPGSTVKPIAALAALGSGKYTPQTTIQCRGYLHQPGSFRCYHSIAHGPVDLRRALKKSCNVYFYTIAERIGRHELLYWFQGLGFGKKPGTGLPEERAGTLPTDTFIRDHYKRRAQPGDGRFLAIGQAGFTASPLQMATAIAAVARGGEYRSPVLALEGAPRQVRRDMPIPQAHGDAVREGMWAVINERGGTAHGVFGPAPLDFVACGKTGTATAPPQKIDTDDDGRGDTIVNQGDMGWFVGFAPYKKPQVAIAVVVEYVQSGGGRTAGPVARDVFELCQALGYVTPDSDR
ncbi:MAG: peptidoglycan D,D-transpeptidase FtsI family protein [Planctomycetota bacterium]